MRIAIVCPYAWDRFGGVQSHVAASSGVLLERGHDVRVFAPGSLNRRLPDVEPHVTLVGRAVGIPANGSVAPLAFGPMAAVGIRSALRDFDPEVIHLHEPLIPSLSFLALMNSDVPSVGTFHAAAPSSWAYRASRPILQRAMGKITVRTAVSEAARDLVARYYPGEFVLTPNGVDIERFGSASPVKPVAGPTVLFFGRIEKRKGLEVLIQAMTRLRDTPVTLLVAGDGPEAKVARSLAARLDVPAHFLGRVSEDDKPGIFRGATVYCAPGLGGESFGIVLVEALAAGTPLVASDLPGYRAVAQAAATLVPPGDAGALADALRAILTDPDKAAEMRKLSSRMAQLYDWKRLAAGIENAYSRASGG